MEKKVLGFSPIPHHHHSVSTTLSTHPTRPRKHLWTK